MTYIALFFIVFFIQLIRQTINSKKVAQRTLWINGTHAVLATLNDWNLKLFGGDFPPDSIPIQDSVKVLEEQWGIHNKEELNNMIYRLRNGLHNPYALQEIYSNGINTMTQKQFNTYIQTIDSELTVIQFKNLYDSYQRFGDNAIMGWDLSRATALCAFGYRAGFFTYEEAFSLATEISKQIQKTFNCWDDFYDSYMYGFVFWIEGDISNPDYNYNYNSRLQIISSLKKDPNSSYYLDWNLNL